MGLYEWFKGTSRNVTVLNDVIWLTRQAKLNAIRQAVAHRLAEQTRPVAIMLVAHFPDCLAELRQIVEQVGPSDSITVASAAALKRETASIRSFDQSLIVDMLASERHPLPSHDEAALNFAQALPCRCRLVHHLSLEDPLIRMFSGERVPTILRRLGMAEDKPIESKMVARQIRSGQEKLASRCFSDYPADSAKEWLERNGRSTETSG
jgi:hypothetical protein